MFREFFNFLPDIAYLKDCKGRYLWVNRIFLEFFGKEEKEVIGKLDSEVLPKELATQWQASDKEVVSFKKTIMKEECLGEIIFETVRFLIPLGEEEVGIAGYSRDITLRKKTENSLKEIEGIYRTITENVSDIIWSADLKFKITYVSPSVEHILGYKPEELLGESVEKVLSPYSWEQVKKVLEEELLREKEGVDKTRSKTLQLEHIHKNGSSIELEVKATFIRDHQKIPTGILGVTRDITQRKQIEKTQRLAQLGKLIADITHEVNNPLMIISGRAQLALMEEIENEEVKKSLKMIVDECQRAKDIIQRVLEYARPSKGEFKATPIDRVIEDVIAIIEHQFQLANISIERDYAPDLPQVYVDEKQIQEVLMNLLVNARDAMPEGGKINIKVFCEGAFLRIDIKDTGIGMSKEVLDKIFEPFFSTKEKGTGLGISICYNIIKAHKGEIKFRSEPQKGTIVTILLPVLKKDG
ncbi:MAG: hypothetical protein DRP68_04220 [Candidatus Omnitrophota bacterium]|nr:MAG: hypothetical protein DRP68_04220 [Candidatus Omnitrophota bacterium]HDN85605.1 PAS domain S-box protein [Candidatus Omnitrophota bacterium]